MKIGEAWRLMGTGRIQVRVGSHLSGSFTWLGSTTVCQFPHLFRHTACRAGGFAVTIQPVVARMNELWQGWGFAVTIQPIVVRMNELCGHTAKCSV